MTRLLLQHAPHLAFVFVGIAAFFWTAYRKPVDPAAPGARATPVPPAQPEAPARVSPAVARRGLLALGPLLCAAGTGAILYGINIGGGSLPGGVLWAHVGVSLLALVLVAYKLAGVDRRKLRQGIRRSQVAQLLSVALGVVSVPLLVSGVDLIFVPRTGTLAAYAHLVTAAWWTGLLLWHLRRYLGASLRTLLRAGGRAPAPASS